MVVTAAYKEGGYSVHLYISVWDGTEWYLQSPIEPPEVEEGLLEGISCLKAEECIAVGQAEYEAVTEHSSPG